MAKTTVQSKTLSFPRDKPLLLTTALVCFVTIYSLWPFIKPWANLSSNIKTLQSSEVFPESPEKTFYDDPTLSYSFGSPVKNWDEKRRVWETRHPSAAGKARDRRVMAITGSQPPPCKNPIGDHLLLRLFKNKVDYCRIHGYDIFYNNGFLEPKMRSVWAKLPPVRAAMVAHPEAEWMWWLDSDVVVTDMEFKIPFEKYGNYNLIINGWEDMIYKKRSWLGMNTGIFLMRNCEWSMEFIEAWANMSSLNPDYDNLTKIALSKLTDKEFPVLDEQSALVYLMLTEKQKWGDKVYIENQYSLSGYWLGIVDNLVNIGDRYLAMEKAARGLRRRQAEKLSERYGALREKYLNVTYDGKGGWRRPFITHFTGCQPCSGHYSSAYTAESCWKGMEKALNFADNQVLRHYGFVHVDLLNSSFVSPLEFDFPAS